MERIGIVGCGSIGRAWAVVFARGGHRVAIWDQEPAATAGALAFVQSALAALASAGLVDEEPRTVAARVEAMLRIEDVLAGAEYVQESTAEDLEVKRQVFATMDALAPERCILASSTSTIPASRFSQDLRGRHRCLVAHPVNPPHLIPAVELSPAPWTAADVLARTRALHDRIGQVPVVIRKEVPGFVVNRLQAVLLMEAWRLVGEGVCSVEDVDRCVRDGLGLRWSFMGPFETIDLNAPGGVADYARRYGESFYNAVSGIRHTPWDDAIITTVAEERQRLLPLARHAEREAWRDRRLMALVAHKRGMAREDA